MSGTTYSDRIVSPVSMASLGYAPLPNRRDEAFDSNGKIVPEWDGLFESIGRHGIGILDEWDAVATRISRERGLAYRPVSVESETDGGWSLDPLPWLISSEKWKPLESGISQRTRLYEALLKDAYGEQRMLSEKLIPAEILLANNGFVRSLHNLTPGGDRVGLGMSAFDIARDTVGNPFVVNDRFDSPFGLGLALENRTVINKVLPRLFRRCGVEQIGQFFIDWFKFLVSQAPGGKEDPLVVILDPSSQNEDSEASFLANYCGVLRVHPADLTVRGGEVWIKTLKGLVPVDVIWKLMSGKRIDALESEIRGGGGISGIFEVMRMGRVSLASHPGSEVLQSPGFYPYLPKLCRAFLDEELELSPVATWWCGTSKALSHVTANLSKMVIKSVGHHHDFQTQYGSRLSSAELERLQERIKAHPESFVGQEELRISTVPTVRADGVVPRGAVLRAFSFPDEEKGAVVMPGGLARVSSADGTVVSTRSEGESKDVWISTGRQPDGFSIASVLERSHPAVPDIVPSQKGENLFWSGRYAERAHAASRFASRVLSCRDQGFSNDDQFEVAHEDFLLEALFEVFDSEKLLDGEMDQDKRLEMVLVNPDCPAGIAYNLNRFHYATQATRESWSPASIRAIESAGQLWQKVSKSIDPELNVSSDLFELQLNLSGFLGLNLDSMTRDEGWALLDAGRRIERGKIITSLLIFLLEGNFEEDMKSLLNESVLFILDSARTYQRRYQDTPQTAYTVQLLLSEVDYPRSIRHVIDRLVDICEKIPDPSQHAHPRAMLAAASRDLTLLNERIEMEIDAGIFLDSELLVEMRKLRDFFINLSDQITVSYFSHTVES
ncbi:MAG: circularly permuted type 2 ATP-grasp protein [Verrucomicrobiales bacterium]|nr:circularly permuted type 2 ATP-grasp protein [Verrucomicrobiales bacterium]